MLAYRFRGSLPDCDPYSAGVTLEPTGDSGVGRVLTCHNYQEWTKQIDESERIANEKKWYVRTPLFSLTRRYVAGPIYLRLFFT